MCSSRLHTELSIYFMLYQVQPTVNPFARVSTSLNVDVDSGVLLKSGWDEVILIDPNPKAICREPWINWIVNPVHNRREASGLISIGEQSRGLGKGHRPQSRTCSLYLEETQHTQPASLSLISSSFLLICACSSCYVLPLHHKNMNDILLAHFMLLSLSVSQ